MKKKCVALKVDRFKLMFKPMKIVKLGILALLLLAIACTNKKASPPQADASLKAVGEIILLNEELHQVVSASAKMELLADGFDWTEGPLWLAEQKKLIWSDVPQNKIFQWRAEDGTYVYLAPSGYTAVAPRGGEMGSNGLLLDEEGRLILCQHGDRRMARMEGTLDQPSANFVTLANSFEGKQFNSPNDAAYGPGGNLYFTDPPYGLEKQVDDPLRELDFQGVYKIAPNGTVTLMTRSLSRPNGIAFNKERTRCYVSNSDPEHAVWMVYDVDDQGDLTNERLFFDATAMVAEGNGLPDGLKVNSQGILFATGPGGLLIFTPEGKHLGTLHTGSPVSNCAFNEDETVLFMTSDAMIVKVDLVGRQ